MSFQQNARQCSTSGHHRRAALDMGTEFHAAPARTPSQREAHMTVTRPKPTERKAGDKTIQAPRLIEFKSPRQLKDFEPPPGHVLVGDCHVTKSSVVVVAGAPGVGKTRASTALAIAGA